MKSPEDDIAYQRQHGYEYSSSKNLESKGSHPPVRVSVELSGIMPISKNKYDVFFQSATYDKNNSGTHRRGVLRVYTPDIRSHFIINSRLDSVILSGGNFDIYNYKYTVRLEGSFGDYFKVSVPSGDEQDVYTILAPNVMEHLIKYFHDFDIEIVDGETYIYSYGDTSTEKMVSMVDATDEFLRLARLRLSDSRTAGPEHAATKGISRTATDNLTRNTFRSPRDIASYILIYFLGSIPLFMIIDEVTDIEAGDWLFPLIIFGPLLIGWVYAMVFIIRRVKLKRKHKVEIDRIDR